MTLKKEIGHMVNEILASTLDSIADRVLERAPDGLDKVVDAGFLRAAAKIVRKYKDLGDGVKAAS